jgi:uncharacterized protein YbjT (DUF2867 family)
MPSPISMSDRIEPPSAPRRVFLTGATGFIGGHVLRLLAARGHAVTCLARGDGARRLREMTLSDVTVVEGEFTRPEVWLPEIEGHDAVVNCVGIIRERPGSRFQAVHADVPIALFEAAARAGVGKIVQVSALGADAGAPEGYFRTKRAADRRLAELGVPYVILRPSIVYGPGDDSMSYFLSLAALPVTPVPGDGRALLQPVHVEDVALGVALAVERDDQAGIAVDLGGAEAMSLDRLLDRLARRLGRRGGARKVHLAWPLVRLAAALTDALGGRGPITRDEMAMLARGSHGDNGPFVERFGFAPMSLTAGLARTPLDAADALYARLRHLRVPLRLLVAAVWLASGLVSAFAAPEAPSLALLAEAGITGALARPVLYGVCLLEVVLGAALAFGYRVRLVGALQLALILVFTAVLTVVSPGLWLEPFGPLTKNLPLIGATLVVMAMEEG